MNLPQGWLADVEANELRRLAKNAVVLELGAWKGRSTVVMAEVATLVVSVDTHRGIVVFADDPGPSLHEYLENVAPYENVVPVIGDWSTFWTMFAEQWFDLVYVDGNHDADSVARDFSIAIKLGKKIAGHDWDIEGVPEGARRAGLADPVHVSGSVAVWE